MNNLQQINEGIAVEFIVLSVEVFIFYAEDTKQIWNKLRCVSYWTHWRKSNSRYKRKHSQ
jgi:hypothetical protein